MHRPVIRQEPKGTGAAVTWAEFVEAGLLRQYRELKVPLPELRKFIELLRSGSTSPTRLPTGARTPTARRWCSKLRSRPVCLAICGW